MNNFKTRLDYYDFEIKSSNSKVFTNYIDSLEWIREHYRENRYESGRWCDVNIILLDEEIELYMEFIDYECYSGEELDEDGDRSELSMNLTILTSDVFKCECCKNDIQIEDKVTGKVNKEEQLAIPMIIEEIDGVDMVDYKTLNFCKVCYDKTIEFQNSYKYLEAKGITDFINRNGNKQMFTPKKFEIL